MIPKRLRFALGILRHPGEARARMRELLRIAKEPPVSQAIVDKGPVDIRLVPVESTDALGEELVGLYRRNPSPFVVGPKTIADLQSDLDNDIRYFLVRNGEGETVGARGFDGKLQLTVGTVTDFPARGMGYQVYAGIKLRKLLACEGINEVRAIVVRSNTRMQRAMLAAGWKLAPHPRKHEMLLGTIFTECDD
jgi:hypothetical protein